MKTKWVYCGNPINDSAVKYFFHSGKKEQLSSFVIK